MLLDDRWVRHVARLVGIATIWGVSASAFGSGFAITEQGALGLGEAYAGGAAAAQDPTTIYFNPAGLTQLAGSRELVAGGALIDPSVQFRNGGSHLNPAFTGGAAVPGSLSGPNSRGGVTAFVPSFYYGQRLSAKVSVGLGLYVPDGLGTRYESAWVGRYHAIKSDLRSIAVTPAIAFKIGDRWSLGLGMTAERLSSQLTNAVDLGALAASRQLAGFTPGNPATDALADVEVASWGWGYTAGLMYRVNSSTRLGISYRSAISETLNGHQTVTVPATIPAALLSSGSQPAWAKITLPDSLTVGAYHKLNGRWALMTDATWTQWSHFQQLVVRTSSGTETVQPAHWRNTVRIALGARYRWSRRLTFQAGVAFDQTPIPNAMYRTPRIPTNSRRWVAVGFSYAVNPRLKLDVGYDHLFLRPAAIDNADPTTGHVLVGTFNTHVDTLAAQARWVF